MKILHCLLHSDTFSYYLHVPLSLMVIFVLQEDSPLSPTFRHLLLLCVLPLSLMVIFVLHEDPPLSPTFRRLLLLFVLPLRLMVIVVLQEDPPLPTTFRHILLLFVLPLSLMVIVVLHSDTFYCYLYFSKPDGDCCSTFRHLPLLFVLPLSLMVIVVLHEDPPTISYIQTPSTAICTSTQPEGDCCPYSKILHCLLHSEKLQICAFPLSQMVIVVLQEDPTLSPTFRRLLLVCVLPLSLMVIGCPYRRSSTVSYIQTPSTDMCTFTQSDGDWCLTGRSSTVAYIQTPSTAICTSTQPDGDCYSTFRHLLLLFVLPLSLMGD